MFTTERKNKRTFSRNLIELTRRFLKLDFSTSFLSERNVPDPVVNYLPRFFSFERSIFQTKYQWVDYRSSFDDQRKEMKKRIFRGNWLFLFDVYREVKRLFVSFSIIEQPGLLKFTNIWRTGQMHNYWQIYMPLAWRTNLLFQSGMHRV